MNEVIHPSAAPDPSFLTLCFEASRDCLAMLDLEGTILAVNPGGAAALGGGDPDALVGRSWAGSWRPADRGEARAAVAGASAAAETVCRTSADNIGNVTWWETRIIAIPGPQGAPERLLAVSRDMTRQHEAGQARIRSARLQQALIEATSEIYWHLDVTTGVTERRGYVEFTGRRDNSSDMDGWLAEVHPEDWHQAKRAADQATVTREALVIEYRLRHRSGHWRWVEDRATPLIDEDGLVTDWVGVITDINDRTCAEKALQKSAEHLRLAVEATALGSWDVDLMTGEREWSPKLYDLLRVPRGQPPSRELFLARVHPDDRSRVDRELRRSGPRDEKIKVSVYRLLAGAGDERWIEAHERTFFGPAGEPVRRVGTLQDITDRKQAEREVWIAAHHDALTGVANRALFQSRLDGAIRDATAAGTRVGLVLVDLDRFKDVNDTLGHEAGDQMLREMANRLRAGVPEAATVARLGGDEFGIIVPAPASPAEVDGLVARLLAALGQRCDCAGRDHDGSASVGWSVYPDHDPQAASLRGNADMALYAAKTSGRGRAKAFTPAMRAEMTRRLDVLRSARDALADDTVVPFYQPKICLRTGRVVGFEALIRLLDGTGLRSPDRFQEALDDGELAVALGHRMLERVAADMRAWNRAGLPFGHVALNLAAPQFSGGSLSDRVLSTLRAAALRPDQLELEITERVLLDDGAGTIGTALRALHEAGVQSSLDDFGTGYASLTHLTRFPVAWVKIDRSFIMNMQQDAAAAAIVTAVIDLAHSIGLRVVAEGIETPDQLRMLAGRGCDLGQGYLAAKPMAASRVPFFLRGWNDPAADVRAPAFWCFPVAASPVAAAGPMPLSIAG